MVIHKIILTLATLLSIALSGGCLKTAAQLPVESLLRDKGFQSAREKTDSADRFVQPSSYFLSPQERYERINQLYMSRAGEIWLEKTRSNVTQLLADTTLDAGMLSVAYGAARGGLHLPQTAYEHKDLSVSTWGFRQLGRVKVGGSFSYSRIWEDSLSDNLTSTADGITPYYYFTPKAGSYERQVYKMGLSLGYDVIKDRLYAGLGLNYLHQNDYGSVDPRLSATWMRVDFTPSLTYKNGNSVIGLSVIKGYGRQDMKVAYKNDMYAHSNAYPERNYYLNMGYGSIVIKSPLVQDILADDQGAALDFSQSWTKHTLRGGLRYLKTYRDNRYKPDTSLINDKLARWSVGQYQGWLQLKSTREQTSSLWSVSWNHEKGHDSNIIFGGRNYFANDNSLMLSFLQYRRIEAGAQRWEWGATVGYHQMERNDILAAHHLSAENFSFGLSGAVYLPSNSADIWSIQMTPSITVPMNVEATVPATQENAFTDRIFYPTISFLGTTRLNNALKLSYTSPGMIGGVYSGFELGFTYDKRLNTGSFDKVQVPEDKAARLTEGAYNPGADRWQFHLAFNLYL